jgi:DNA repair protein RecO
VSEDEILVIRHSPYGESSLIISALSAQNGRLQLIMRSARKVSGKGAAIPDRLRHLHVRFRRGKSDLCTLEESELIRDFQPLTRHIPSFLLATWQSGFLLRNAHPELPVPETFSNLLAGFSRMVVNPTGANRRAIALGFCFSYLAESGLLPEFSEAHQSQAEQVIEAGASDETEWPRYSDDQWQALVTWCLGFMQRCDLHVPAKLSEAF